jgi:NitT/TauT family transport system permease protein
MVRYKGKFKMGTQITLFIKEYYLFLITIFLILLFWEAIVNFLTIPSYILPPPSKIIDKLITSNNLILKNTFVTIKEVAGGFLVGTVGAILLAVIIVHSKIMEKIFYPLMVISQTFPKESLAPLFVIWLGYGLLPKVVMSALISFFPIAINSIRGFTSVEPLYIDLMKSLSATKLQIFFKLRLPNALPYIFAALKVSITLSLIGAIIGEFVGATAGLGHLIILSNSQLQTDLLFAVIFVLAFIGVTLFSIIDFLEKRLLYWQESDNTLGKEIIVR